MEAVNPQNLEPVHDSVRSRPRPRPRSRSRRSNSRGVPSVSKQLLSRPSHAIVRSLRCSGAGPSGSWRGWPIRIQDCLLRPPPRELDRGLLSLSLNGMFHRKRLWVVRFFWNSSHLLRVRRGLRLAPASTWEIHLIPCCCLCRLQVLASR
jgi:hypothetical protein